MLTGSPVLRSGRVVAGKVKRNRHQDIQLLRAIVEAPDPEEVFEIVSECGPALSVIHTTTALHRLATLDAAAARERSKRRPAEWREQLPILLEYHGQQAAESTVEGRSFSNGLWAFAKLRVDAEAGTLLTVLNSAAGQWDSVQWKPVDLSIAAWALGTLACRHEAVMEGIARSSKERLEDFPARSLANLLWAVATIEWKDDELTMKLAQQSMSKSQELKAMELSAVVWSFAKLQFTDLEILSTLPTRVLPRLQEFNDQSLSNTVWSFAHLEVVDDDNFFDLAAERAAKLKDKFAPQHVANTLWAFAKTSHPDERLFEAMSEQLPRVLPRCCPMDVSNIAWAFARAKVAPRGALQTLAPAATKSMPGFTEQGLANVVWAYASLLSRSPPVFDAAAETVLETIDAFGPQALSMVAWSYSALSLRHRPLMEAVALQGACVADRFTPEAAGSLLWSLSSLSFLESSSEATETETEPGLQAAKALLASPAVASMHSGDSWEGHPLCILANALYPVRDKLEASAWKQVESRWLTSMSKIIETLQTAAFPAPQDYVQAVASHKVFHVGPHYTKRFISDLGVGTDEFPNQAKTTLWQEASVHLAPDDIVAFVKHDLKIHIETAAGSSMHLQDTWYIASAAGAPSLSPVTFTKSLLQRPVSSQPSKSSDLVSVPLAHDRGGHAELKAMQSLLQTLGEALGNPITKPEPRVTGTVHLYANHHLCLSCLGALSQFRAALPNVDLQVSFDWVPDRLHRVAEGPEEVATTKH